MNSSFWHEAPLLRLILPFIAGILFAVYSPFYHFSIIILLLILFILCCIALGKKLHIHYAYSWLFGILIYFFLFFCGYELCHLHNEKFSPHHFNHISDIQESIIKINDAVQLKEKSVSTRAEVVKMKSQGKWQSPNGKILIYFAKDTNSIKLEYGDIVAIHADIKEITPPQNPEEFNYKQYMAFHSIYHQAYVKSDDWKLMQKNEGNILFHYSISAQNFLVKLFKDQGIEDQELAVLSALLLGAREHIDPELVHAYASTGALHVLSVSGLHVGLIYVVLGFLFSFLNKLKHGNKIKAILLLLFLWIYAFITGLPPSVSRAAAMFSFIIIGQSFKRPANLYNTLSASALLQLLFDPYIIMEVGFQLSYLAVIGIVALQPQIYKQMYTSNWVLDKIWALSSVSLAAQIITFPLGLLYFHQFPNYFLLSNLIVIPISTLIIYVSIGFLLCSAIPIVSIWMAALLKLFLSLLNNSVLWIEKFPFALIEGISISVFQTWIIYLAIICLVFYFNFRNKIILYSFFLSVIIFLCTEIIEKYNQMKQKMLIVYHVKGESAIDLIDGKQHIFLSSDNLMANEGKMLFHIKHNWWSLGLNQPIVFSSSDTSIADICINKNIIRLKEKNILLLNDSLAFYHFPYLHFDCLILSGNIKASVSEIKNNFSFDMLIIDSSNSQYRRTKWIKECIEQNLPYFDVVTKGAFITQ
jgi:competence protein ComEC